MLCQLSRATRARSVVGAITRQQMRGFIAPTVSRRADFVQELYLKELKSYKVPTVKDSDSVGQVQTFITPKTPSSPEESDLAGSLKEYENMAVEIEGQESVSATAQPAELPDWLETEDAEDAKAH
ncbi:ATP synthase subunit H-like protein [Emericellopsis cladophorae]|uniref:ATP synthase subunit H-like protein n=1 Tax=Emericellopsis cladophorae TaxID=2686198 RepID=A0A9P9Y2C0_9HYPO|nr:ATP synthase subunit H-like protein [Emericellopsis cladophorae]KAI6782231.1 ATP synthase subunit H-like protein [Emericellopsis cladophorae]